jgi:hypothetical protein
LNLAISIDGHSLVSEGTASAASGKWDIAIAYGGGASASAEGGNGDFALADGGGAFASAGGLSGDTGADYDSAIDVGNNSGGAFDGAYAGNGDLGGGGGTGSGDTAIDIGNNTSIQEGSFAGAGGLLGGSGNGNDDTAIDIGNNGSVVRGSEAYDGNDNHAGVFGYDSFAGTGYGGNNNVAEVVGPHSIANAVQGNDNVGLVFDPSGTDGSDALVGQPGDSDLSAVFGDGLSSDYATGGSFLYDILSPSGDLPGSASGFLAELLSLF